MYKEHSLQSSLFFFFFFFFFPQSATQRYMEEGQAKGQPLSWNHFLTRPKSRSVEKSKSIAQQNSPALQATRNIIKLFIEREPMLITLLASLLLKYQK